MNRQNFTATNSYPLSTQTMALLQDSIAAVAELSRIGGANYILSGCEQSGNSVNNGVIVINGEPMPFQGGQKLTNITIVETLEDVLANGTTYKNARTKRHAQFASGTGANYLPWANFKPLPTNQQLDNSKAALSHVNSEIEKLTANSVPKGAIVMWSGAVNGIPQGWALCDGARVSGVQTPNLRGKFIVGYDPYDSSYSNIGNSGGQGAIALSVEQMPKHRHLNGMVDDQYEMFINGYTKKIYQAITIRGEGENANCYQGYTSYTGGEEKSSEDQCLPHENRPPYYTLAYIIKVI